MSTVAHYIFKLECNCNPVGENLTIGHTPDELEYGCRRIQNFQYMRAVPELWDLIKGHVVNELAALEENPTLEMFSRSLP
jgi:hypothetical protein